ncbi:MAG: hypothetical protein AABW67_00610 [Nanoarchaeota archaeon]
MDFVNVVLMLSIAIGLPYMMFDGIPKLYELSQHNLDNVGGK